MAQATQAVAGLALQLIAARTLGAAGLATFSLIYGAIVLLTAVSSGLVGDSLIVLDRSEPRTRAGLHVLAVLVAGGAGILAAVLAVLSAVVPLCAGLLLGLAVTCFIVEDTLRRLLMATGRFWSLPAVDATSLGLAMLTLAGCALSGTLSLSSFVLALIAGQVGAAAMAWWRLPPAERPRGPWRGPDLRGVLSFGVWRAATQTMRPGLLTLLRLLVIGVQGATAYGPLEAARLYTAPSLVLVAGLGSYLLPHFVAMRDRPAGRSVRAADRAAVTLAGAVAAIGLVAVALQSVVAPVLTGGDYPVPALAVAGWCAYAVAAAALLPYAGLATVYRQQRRVLAVRALEFAALSLVWAVLLWVEDGEVWAPLALAAGPLLAALAVRQLVLMPVLRTEERQAALVEG